MKRTLHLWLLALVCLAGLALRSEGIRWPFYHPDEHPIARWIEWTREHAYVGERFYANGFFTLARPVRAATEAVQAACERVGRHLGARNEKPEIEGWILWARGFNVALGVATVLLIFGLVRRVTGSPSAGLFAAAMLAVSPYPVEHSHYGETDIAMLATLIVALWGMAAALERGGGWRLAGASFACGFAAGTKLPLLALLPALAAVAVLAPRDGGGRPWLRIPLRLAGVALAGLAGFYVAHPGVAHWTWFSEAMRIAGQKVYQETTLNLGPLAGDAHVRHLAHLRQLGGFADAGGWGVLLLAAAGVPLALGVRYRRFWPVILLFPAVFFYYWVFRAPWVRSQESMVFLPGLFVLAALPLMALWRRPRAGARVAALALGVWAVAGTGWRGAQVASLFGWDDTRVLAREWLERHLPYESAIAAERYSGQACPETRAAPLDITKIERTGLDGLQAARCQFVLRTASYCGRGLEHPLTGRRYPAAERVFQEFLGGFERLGAWAPMPPRDQATFVSPDIELYGVRPLGRGIGLDVLLPQPTWASERVRETVFPELADLGASTALRIDRRVRQIALAGPADPRRPVYLVAWTRERGAAVRAEGFGRSIRMVLAPYDVAVARLDRPAWRPRMRHYEAVSVRTEPERNVMLVPCYARLAMSPAEVVQALAAVGQDDRAWEFFGDDELRRSVPPASLYEVAVRARRWETAAALRDSARRVFESLAEHGSSPPEELRVRGRSGAHIAAFSRVHVAPPRQVVAQVLVRKKDEDDRPIEPPVYETELEVPMALAMGRFSVDVELRMGDAAPATNTPIVMELVEELRDMGRRIELPALSDERYERVSFSVTARQSLGFRLRIQAAAPLTLYSRDLSVRWTFRDALESVRDRLGMALAADALHAGDRQRATELLAKATEEPWNGLELRELALAGDPASAPQAERLLALAPGHFQALRSLAAARPDPELAERVDGLGQTLSRPVEFGRFLRLISAERVGGDRLRCVFEALRNDTPEFAAVLWDPALGTRKWKKLAVVPIAPRVLARGERVAVMIQLPSRGGLDLARLALGVRADVRWQPGVLRAEGCDDPGIRLAGLLAP